jgi:hypothetical protein
MYHCFLSSNHNLSRHGILNGNDFDWNTLREFKTYNSMKYNQWRMKNVPDYILNCILLKTDCFCFFIFDSFHMQKIYSLVFTHLVVLIKFLILIFCRAHRGLQAAWTHQQFHHSEICFTNQVDQVAIIYGCIERIPLWTQETGNCSQPVESVCPSNLCYLHLHLLLKNPESCSVTFVYPVHSPFNDTYSGGNEISAPFHIYSMSWIWETLPSLSVIMLCHTVSFVQKICGACFIFKSFLWRFIVFLFHISKAPL